MHIVDIHTHTQYTMGMTDKIVAHGCVDCIKTRFNPILPGKKTFCLPPEKVMESMANAMKNPNAPQVENVINCDHPQDFEEWTEETV